MNKIKTASQGFSLVEVIISLAIFSFLITAVIGLALGSFSFFSYGKSMNQAEELAHEAAEAVKIIGSETWDELKYSRSAVDFVSGKWILVGEGTTEQLGAYTRVINFVPVYRDDSGAIVASSTSGAHEDVLSKMINIVISWNSDRGTPQVLVKDFLLTAWKTQN